jgi:hypothetical protein
VNNHDCQPVAQLWGVGSTCCSAEDAALSADECLPVAAMGGCSRQRHQVLSLGLEGGVIQGVVALYQIEFLPDQQGVEMGLQLAKAFIEVVSFRRSAENKIFSGDTDLYLPGRALKGGAVTAGGEVALPVSGLATAAVASDVVLFLRRTSAVAPLLHHPTC